ncbi:MAG: hypothetical protein IPJ79_18645 [Bacteroidetes bacterium]|nr:hypothetical protein [Bacteroidota bacterium]
MSTDRILFQHPDALELFCRIVCKFDSTRKKDDRDKFSEESITLNSLTSNDTFRRVITFYSSEERCDRVSDAIYNVDQSKKVGTSGAKVIYTLSKAVRFKEPFSFVEGALSPILKYLNDGSEQKETYKPKYSTIEVWKPEFKERLYENTVWNLFYRDTQIAKSKSEEDIHGIVNAYLHLQQFSKAEIYNFNVDQDVTLKDQKKYSEEYEGYYEFYNNQNYILFNLKTKSVNEKKPSNGSLRGR